MTHVCAPEDGLGEAYVMHRLEGETLGRRIVRDEAFTDVRSGLARRCGEVLAMSTVLPWWQFGPKKVASRPRKKP